MHQQVEIVIDQSMRGLCKRPYPNHKKGCPNYNKRHDCPPKVPLISKVFDLSKPIYAIWNVFDFGGHTARMRDKHPQWSDRQVECCLYWQGTARKQLKAEVETFTTNNPGYVILTTPEACGVNITETMKRIGIELEWPPVTVAHQVALAGIPVDKVAECSSAQLSF
jgi:predicted metal-binding protein